MRRMGLMVVGLVAAAVVAMGSGLTKDPPGILNKAAVMTNQPIVTVSDTAPLLAGNRTNVPGVKWLAGWKHNATLVTPQAVTNGSVNVTLAWDQEANVDGYNLYWGVSSRTYSHSLGTTTNTITITNLSGTVFFAVTGVAGGLESAYSSEVSWSWP